MKSKLSVVPTFTMMPVSTLCHIIQYGAASPWSLQKTHFPGKVKCFLSPFYLQILLTVTQLTCYCMGNSLYPPHSTSPPPEMSRWMRGSNIGRRQLSSSFQMVLHETWQNILKWLRHEEPFHGPRPDEPFHWPVSTLYLHLFITPLLVLWGASVRGYQKLNFPHLNEKIIRCIVRLYMYSEDYHLSSALSSTRFRWLQDGPGVLTAWAIDDIYVGEKCPHMCSGRGDCVRGVCHCDQGYFGENNIMFCHCDQGFSWVFFFKFI